MCYWTGSSCHNLYCISIHLAWGGFFYYPFFKWYNFSFKFLLCPKKHAYSATVCYAKHLVPNPLLPVCPSSISCMVFSLVIMISISFKTSFTYYLQLIPIFFILCSFRVFTFAGVVGIFILLPVNYLGNQLNVDISDFSHFSNKSLDSFSISNVNNGSKWWVSAGHTMITKEYSFPICFKASKFNLILTPNYIGFPHFHCGWEWITLNHLFLTPKG